LRDTLKTRPKATTFVPGEAMAKDASAALLSMPDYDKLRNAEFGELIGTRLGIEIVYKSFYGEKFTLTWHRSKRAAHDKQVRE